MNRPGIRYYSGQFDYSHRPRNSWLRRFKLSPSDSTILGLDNRLQTGDDALALELTMGDDVLTTTLEYFREVIAAPYSLPGNVVVGAGLPVFPAIDRAADRTVPPRLGALGVYLLRLPGRPFDRERPARRCAPVSAFQTGFPSPPAGHRPPGRPDHHPHRSLNAIRNFTPEMKLVAELQYDNVSHQFRAPLRYRWEIRPTTELLVTLGESALLYERIPNGSYRSQATAVSVRLGHRFQN